MNLGGERWNAHVFRDGRTGVIQMQCSWMTFSTTLKFFQCQAIYLLYRILWFLNGNHQGGGPNISESCEGTEYILSAVLHEYIVCFQELNTSNIKITIRPTQWHYKNRGMILGLPKDSEFWAILCNLTVVVSCKQRSTQGTSGCQEWWQSFGDFVRSGYTGLGIWRRGLRNQEENCKVRADPSSQKSEQLVQMVSVPGSKGTRVLNGNRTWNSENTSSHFSVFNLWPWKALEEFHGLFLFIVL